ncbi:AraC family transcriptional regulator [Radiobacillus deserti]|uniref:DNA gyrase inhibitor n=1 Tax=Radiobacillus deserti TaxID=2594883 RepID=A0A516KID6_9BACI|nr:GyrI-like domain-containing protein [Radiobacillus deserti]QDP41154.1 DNA gyrase inhibitor [Radiobacillus deserti]
MRFKVEAIPNLRVAYVRGVGPYGPANKEVMERLKSWARKRNLLHSATLLAIPQDNPETTPPEDCRFDACIVLSAEYQIGEDINETELTGGKYLIYEVEHTAEAMQKAYADIIPSLQTNGYQMDSKPIMERYKQTMVDRHYCEICVPVKP